MSLPSRETDARRHVLERIGDAAVVQVYADGFCALPLERKVLAWHLYEAAIAGRDIYYDQRHRDALAMRDLLELVLRGGAAVDAAVDSGVVAEIRRYTKLFWINTGPYNALTARKFVLALSPAALRDAVLAAARASRDVAVDDAWLAQLREEVERLTPMFLDPTVDPVVTNKTPGAGRDILESSATNLYEGVRTSDLEGFDERYPLNSRLVKRSDGRLEEDVYRVGGRCDREIRRIVACLEQAAAVAPPATATALRALTRWYRTGDDADRLAYDIAWVADDIATVDTINGFVEVYMDPRGVKGAWEAIVYYEDAAGTARMRTLAAHAARFEAAMPWDARYCRLDVQGVAAQAIDVVIETGDSGPMSAVGINLPNDQAVRERYGSKSVSLSNVARAYELSTPDALRTEFAWDADEAARARDWNARAQELSTQLHEVIGHGSGRMNPSLTLSPQAYLREHFSAIEEARADLVALYFIADPLLVEIGAVRADEQPHLVRAEYEHYARTALVQLRRVRDGLQLEEDHMRNRQLVVHWLLAHTSAIERRQRDGRTFLVVVDIDAFRVGAGRLLAEVQRIKAEGDLAAAEALLDTYGIHVDAAVRDEVLRRVDALELPSYTAFVMPRLSPVVGDRGDITDVVVSYPLDLETQMLEYSARSRASHDLPSPAAVR